MFLRIPTISARILRSPFSEAENGLSTIIFVPLVFQTRSHFFAHSLHWHFRASEYFSDLESCLRQCTRNICTVSSHYMLCFSTISRITSRSSRCLSYLARLLLNSWRALCWYSALQSVGQAFSFSSGLPSRSSLFRKLCGRTSSSSASVSPFFATAMTASRSRVSG